MSLPPYLETVDARMPSWKVRNLDISVVFMAGLGIGCWAAESIKLAGTCGTRTVDEVSRLIRLQNYAVLEGCYESQSKRRSNAIVALLVSCSADSRPTIDRCAAKKEKKMPRFYHLNQYLSGPHCQWKPI